MVTIFTPTYNRAYIVNKLYDSLCHQTSYDFEWIVVDDGSTDNTEQLFAEILKKSHPFEIKYFRQDNGGKHRAINRGVQLAHGDLFFIVDSDDRLTENAVESIVSWANQLPDDRKWAGVAGLKGYDRNHMIGTTFPGEFLDATSLDRSKYGIEGDKAEVFFTEVLRQFPFQEFEGEKFLTENTVWLKIAQAGYYLRWYNHVIYLCDYLEDGLTKNMQKIRFQNPQGALYTARVYLECFKDIKTYYRTIYNYYEVGVFHGLTVKNIASNLGVSKFKVRMAILLQRIYHLFR